MQFQTRDHAAALTGILSVIALAFVLRTVLRMLSVGALSHAPAGITDTTSSTNTIVSLSPEVFVE